MFLDMETIGFFSFMEEQERNSKQPSPQYVVRFVRKDGQPDEEYYYNQKEDAEYHVSLFENDDSDLYERIEIGCLYN